jgi:TM2 domain-containing membrane protein YozV
MVSKTALIFISNSPLGMLGVDRLYMGCYRSAFIKFVLFLLVFLFAIPLEFPLEVAVFLVLAFSLWTMYDWLVIAINSLSRSTETPFCRKVTEWTGRRDIIFAFWMSVFISLPQLMLIVTGILMSIFMGFETFVDGLREETKTEKYIPSGYQMKEFFTLKKKK